MAPPNLRALLPGRTTALALVASVGLIALILMAAYAADLGERPAREARRWAREHAAQTPDFTLLLGTRREERPFLPYDLWGNASWEEQALQREAAQALRRRIESALQGASSHEPGTGRFLGIVQPPATRGVGLEVLSGVGFVLDEMLREGFVSMTPAPVRCGRATKTPWGLELECSDPGGDPFRFAQLVLLGQGDFEVLVPVQNLQPFLDLLDPFDHRWRGAFEDCLPLVLVPERQGRRDYWNLPIAWANLPQPFRRAIEADLPVTVVERIQHPADSTRYALVQLTVDAGSAEGVFVGLRFCHAEQDWGQFEAIVQHVEEHRADLLAVQLAGSGPAVEPGWVLHTRYVW